MSLPADPVDEDAVPPARRRSRRKVATRLLLCLTLLVTIPLGAALYVGHRLSANVHRIPGVFAGLEHRPATSPGPAGEAVNILLVGTEARSDLATTGSDGRAMSWLPGAPRSDALMILHIDRDRRAASVISIPRDTWVTVPGHGMHRLNDAFSMAGPALAVATVELLTSVRIDHLAVVEWAGFEALIDAHGGIEIAVPETVTDPARNVTWTAGVHRLDGRQALDYVGQRDGLPHGDLDRVARQQEVLRALVQNALEQEMRKDPRLLLDFLDTVTRHLSVDDGWSTRDLVRLTWSMRGVRTAEMSYLTMPVAGFGDEAGQRVVYADRRASRSLWDAVIADELDEWTSR